MQKQMAYHTTPNLNVPNDAPNEAQMWFVPDRRKFKTTRDCSHAIYCIEFFPHYYAVR